MRNASSTWQADGAQSAVGSGVGAFRFGLLPTLSAEQALQLKGALAPALGPSLEVEVCRSYDALFEGVRSGRLHAAWASPFLCARLEAQGTQVAVWGVRRNAPTYRSALVARAGAGLTLERLAGARAAWVDPDSTGGYLLGAMLLKSKGLDPRRLFQAQAFLGNYRRALEAVRDGAADVTAVYCPPASTGRTFEAGIEDVLPGEAGRFALVAYTEEAPNGGVVVAGTVPKAAVARLESAFLGLGGSAEGRALLGAVFSGMDGFERAPQLGYRAIYRLAVSAL